MSDPRNRARSRARRPSPELLVGTAVLAGIGAILLAAVALVLKEPAGSPVPSVSPETQSALTLLSKPSTERVPLAGSAGTAVLAVGSGGRAAIVLKRFGAAAAGSTYYAWVRNGGGPFVAAGTFDGTERVVLLSSRVKRGGVVGVTSEVSEVDAPSTPPSLIAVRP